MVSCAEKIIEGLSRDPKRIASLLAKRLISDAVVRETIELNETKVDKAKRLYTTVLNVVKHCPEKYNHFVWIFRGPGRVYTDLLELLEIKGISCMHYAILIIMNSVTAMLVYSSSDGRNVKHFRDKYFTRY